MLSYNQIGYFFFYVQTKKKSKVCRNFCYPSYESQQSFWEYVTFHSYLYHYKQLVSSTWFYQQNTFYPSEVFILKCIRRTKLEAGGIQHIYLFNIKSNLLLMCNRIILEWIAREDSHVLC